MKTPEIEKKLLACILADAEECRSSVEILSDNDFFVEEYRAIFRAFKPLFSEGGIVTTPRVENALESATIDKISKDDIILEITKSAYSAIGHEIYAKQVLENSKILNLEHAAKLAIETKMMGGGSDEMIKIMSDAVKNIDSREGQKIRDAKQMALDFAEQSKKIMETGASGLTIGLKWMDELWAGLEPGDTHIVAGRPASGKSMLLLQMAMEMSKTKNVLFFALEMGERQNISRALSNLTGINSSAIRNVNFPQRDTEKIIDGMKEFVKRKLYCPSKMSQTINGIISLSTRAKREKNIDVIFIDYLTLIQGDSKGRNRHEFVGEISRGLKSLAADLNIPIVIAAQLNRDSEKEKREPYLSDLRECGDIEQDASKVVFVHRNGDVTNLIKAKDRHFETKKITTKLIGSTSTFYPVESNEREEW